MERYVRVKKIGEGSFGKALLVKKKRLMENNMSSRKSAFLRCVEIADSVAFKQL